MSENVHTLFAPNPTVIRAHLERLFRRPRVEYPDGKCEIAWSNEHGAPNHAETFPITPEGLDRATECAVKRNNDSRNCYVGPNPRKADCPPFGRCRGEDVEIAYFQFVEADSAAAAQKVRQAPLPYTWVVLTGRTPNPRPHAYWELEDAVRNMDAWTEQQRALAAYFGGDAVIDRSRIMRLGGTVNYPTSKKLELGYRRELVTYRSEYDGEERQPVSSEALFHSYPWKPNGHATPNGHAPGSIPNGSYDPETGEIYESVVKPNLQTGRIDVQECIRQINAGHNLHNNTRAVIDHLISTGHSNWLIRDYAARLLKPVSDGGTLSQIDGLIRSWRTKTGIHDPVEEVIQDGNTSEFILTSIGILDDRKRPGRDWLVPYRMMRRHITMTTAAPGVGKTTLAIEEGVSLASGMDFLGFGIIKPHKVAIINNEETRDELERRIEATCRHFDVPPEAIAENLYLYSGVDAEKIILARVDKNDNVLPTVNVMRLRQLIVELQLDVVILDPFVQLHYVKESSNEQISQTMVLIRSLGIGDYPAAIHLVHHNRKPVAGNSHQAGDLSSARGASAMGGEAHFFFTLTDMGEKDGEKLNIPEDDRVNYLRLDDAKGKMAPAQGARWFERHGEMMPYGLVGEEVGILVPHDIEELKNDISSYTAMQILTLIDKAWQEKEPYTNAPSSKTKYIVNAMMKEFSITRHAAKGLISDWLDNAIIRSEMYDTHRKLTGLKVIQWPG
jgi:hypothetical protein